MQLSRPTLLPWTTSQVQYQHPYFTVFDGEYVDVWRVPGQGVIPELLTRLSHVVPYPGLADPSNPQTLQTVVDSENILVVVPEKSHDGMPPVLWIFSLGTGALLQKVELSGQLVQVPLSYRDGKVTVLVADDENDPPYVRMTLLICDVVRDNSPLGGVRIPTRLGEREWNAPNTDSILWPALITPDFDLIATSSQAWEDTMEVLRYRTSKSVNHPEPDASLQLTETIDDGDTICPTYAILSGERNFALAVYEGSAALPQGHGCQSKIYAIDFETLTVRWCTQPVWGRIGSLHLLSSLNTIIAVVEHNTGEEWGDGSPMATYIVAVDVITGARKRMDAIYHGVQGSAVVKCAVTHGSMSEEPFLVVVYKNGALSVVNATSFLSDGLPRDGEQVQVKQAFSDEVVVDFAYVVERSVVMSIRGTEDHTTSDMRLVCWS